MYSLTKIQNKIKRLSLNVSCDLKSKHLLLADLCSAASSEKQNKPKYEVF